MLRLVTCSVLAALALAAAGNGAGAATADLRQEDRPLNDRAVPDIHLRLADGRTMPLSALAGDEPLVVMFFYRRCAGLCLPLLRWLRDAVTDAGGLNTDYRVLALSFDEADMVTDLHAQAGALGLLHAEGWSFAVAEPLAISNITAALDFRYRFDPEKRQFDHPALLAVVDHGRVSRTLRDGSSGKAPYRDLLRELRGTFVPFYRLARPTPLRCFTFDPRTGEIRFDRGSLLLALPALAALSATLVIFLGSARRPRHG